MTVDGLWHGPPHPRRVLTLPGLRVRKLSPLQEAVLRTLADGEPRTCRQIGAALNRTRSRIGMLIPSLQGSAAQTLVVETGVGEYRARMYTITELGLAMIV